MRRLLAVLLVLLMLVPVIANSQSQTSDPQVFWGKGEDWRDHISAVNESGLVVAHAAWASNGIWTILVFEESASRVSIERTGVGPVARTAWFVLNPGWITEIRATDFGTLTPQPQVSLDPDDPKLHRFSGTGFPNVTIAAVVPPGGFPPESGNHLLQATRVVNGSWSMEFPDAGLQFGAAVFEFRVEGLLYRTSERTLGQGRETILKLEDFHQLPAAHAFWGTGLAKGKVRVLGWDRGSLGNYGSVRTGDESWSLVLPDAFEQMVDFVVLEFVKGTTIARTVAIPYEPGSLLRVDVGAFGQRERPIPAMNDSSQMDTAPPEPSQVEIVIIARLRGDDRVEFGLRSAATGESVLPRQRFLPVGAPINRWMLSSPITVNDILIGRVIARRLSNGRIEFGIRPNHDAVADIFAEQRYFPPDSQVDLWRKSGVISVPNPP